MTFGLSLEHSFPMIETRSYIGGDFVNPNEDKWFEQSSPVTHELISRVPNSGLMDVVRAVQAANKGYSAWQKEPKASCSDACQKIADSLLQAALEIALIQSQETGLPFTQSMQTLHRAVALFRFYSGLSAEIAGMPSAQMGAKSSHLVRSNYLPIGVVALILPAHDPVIAFASRLAAALAAGNVVIAKASSSAPRTYDALARAIHRSGLSPGVFNLLQGRGVAVGQAIVQHPGLSTLSFAGRTDTGRIIAQEASEPLKRLQMSLSACNSILVFDGVEVEQVAKLVAGLSLSGRAPAHLRGARVFVQERIYKEFLSALEHVAKQIVIGDPSRPETDLGPLIRVHEKQRFTDAVSQALKERGKLLPQSAEMLPERGNFVRPTVVYDVSLCSTLQQEEILGPLAMVESFKYQHDAIKTANNSPFGQIAYVFHADPDKAATIGARISAGRVILNPGVQIELPLEASFGGLRASGFGREGGLASFEFFSRQTMTF